MAVHSLPTRMKSHRERLNASQLFRMQYGSWQPRLRSFAEYGGSLDSVFIRHPRPPSTHMYKCCCSLLRLQFGKSFHFPISGDFCCQSLHREAIRPSLGVVSRVVLKILSLHPITTLQQPPSQHDVLSSPTAAPSLRREWCSVSLGLRSSSSRS